MKAFKIFLVEDDIWFSEMMKYHLSLNPEFEVIVFHNAKDCLNNIHLNPDVICIDYGLPDMKGDILLTKIHEINTNFPVIVISGQEEISVAINFLKDGATDYILKNDNAKTLLWNSIIKVRENSKLKQEVEVLKEQLGNKFSFEKTIIGNSSSLKETFNLINKAIKTNINVSITGETGTGKEVVAKAIHFNSDKKKKPFVAVNMGAIPNDLIESELFGHEKGAFTGADSRKIGKFEQANGGTIFLDEIAELDLNLQSKILRVLQEREVVRVGGKDIIKINARLITATHKDLKEEVKKGNFREDLFYRIIGLPINLPPLRDRDNDVLILGKHFINLFVKDNKLKSISISKEAAIKLSDYSFPGNVRELKSVIDLACVLCDNYEIEEKDIIFNSIKDEEVFSKEEKSLKEYTNEIINHFYNKYNNDVLKVAEILKIGKSTIYNLLKSGEISQK